MGSPPREKSPLASRSHPPQPVPGNGALVVSNDRVRLVLSGDLDLGRESELHEAVLAAGAVTQIGELLEVVDHDGDLLADGTLRAESLTTTA